VNCAPINVPGSTVSLCSQFALTVPNTTAVPNTITVSYSGSLSACTAQSGFPVFTASAPSFTSFAPSSYPLSALPQNLTLLGSFQTYNNTIMPAITLGGKSFQTTFISSGCTGSDPETCTTLILNITSAVAALFSTGVSQPLAVSVGSCSATAPGGFTFILG